MAQAFLDSGQFDGMMAPRLDYHGGESSTSCTSPLEAQLESDASSDWEPTPSPSPIRRPPSHKKKKRSKKHKRKKKKKKTHKSAADEESLPSTLVTIKESQLGFGSIERKVKVKDPTLAPWDPQNRILTTDAKTRDLTYASTRRKRTSISCFWCWFHKTGTYCFVQIECFPFSFFVFQKQKRRMRPVSTMWEVPAIGQARMSRSPQRKRD